MNNPEFVKTKSFAWWEKNVLGEIASDTNGILNVNKPHPISNLIIALPTSLEDLDCIYNPRENFSSLSLPC